MSANKELSIGEVGIINCKTVMCVKDPTGRYDTCYSCAFYNSNNCPPFGAKARTDNKDVFFPEIKKGL